MILKKRWRICWKSQGAQIYPWCMLILLFDWFMCQSITMFIKLSINAQTKCFCCIAALYYVHTISDNLIFLYVYLHYGRYMCPKHCVVQPSNWAQVVNMLSPDQIV
jgi:hypothetical protein